MATSPPSPWSKLRLPTSRRGRTTLFTSFLAVFLLWWITPTPSNLYLPSAHLSETRPVDEGIVNSIIVPAYNEAGNMEALVTRIFAALPSDQSSHTEILIIDDSSTDSTSSIISSLQSRGYNVHLHVRTTERGLSSAVLHGFSLAKGSKLLVMDADLQHPPESVPSLLNALDQRVDKKQAPHDYYRFALGTRYGKGVEMDKDWPLYRRLISWGARLLSRPLTNAQDPMGGFFALKKELYLASQPLNPSGFKIGLELLLKTPLTGYQLTHVPYGFAKRKVGSSKLGMKVMIKYVGQLLALYRWKFGLVWWVFVGGVVAGVCWGGMWLLEWGLRSGRLDGYPRTGHYVELVVGGGEKREGKGKGLLPTTSMGNGRRRKDKWDV